MLGELGQVTCVGEGAPELFGRGLVEADSEMVLQEVVVQLDVPLFYGGAKGWDTAVVQVALAAVLRPRLVHQIIERLLSPG